MKGGGLGRPPPDAGIPHDMKTLLNAFKERNSLRLIEFYEVAVNYGLKDIYAGRMSVADLVGFAECLLNAAFAYTRPCKEYPNGLGEEQTITERIFGIYVTFVLFYAQPIDYVTKIRMLPEDCVSIVHFAHEILLPGSHIDAYACLQRLFCDGAFRIVMSIKDYDLSNHRRYEKPNPVELLVDEDERYEPLEAASSIVKHPVLKAMTFVERKMEQKEMMLFNRRITERENDKFNFLDRLQNIYATLAHEFYKADNEIEEDIFEKWKCSTSATARKKQPESTTAQKARSVKAVENGAARGKRKLES